MSLEAAIIEGRALVLNGHVCDWEGRPVPWYVWALGDKRVGAFQYVLVSRHLLDDAPAWRGFVQRHVRSQVEQRWQESYGDAPHGRMFFKFEDAEAVYGDYQNGVVITAALLMPGERPNPMPRQS